MSEIRYVAVKDESGHRFYIPTSKFEEFHKLMERWDDCCDDPWPEWLKSIDGGDLTFTDPKIERLW